MFPQPVSQDLRLDVIWQPKCRQPAVQCGAAKDLCDGDALATYAEDGYIRSRAQVGNIVTPPAAERLYRTTASGRAYFDRRTIHIRDYTLESEEEYPLGKQQAVLVH